MNVERRPRGRPLQVPRFARWLASRAVGAESLPVVLGDLIEGYESYRGRLSPRAWFMKESVILWFRTGADDVREAAAGCPLDRLLVETDAPFLAPVPHRGRPNRPALVPVVGAAVAEVQGRGLADVAAATVANSSRVYALDRSST